MMQIHQTLPNGDEWMSAPTPALETPLAVCQPPESLGLASSSSPRDEEYDPYSPNLQDGQIDLDDEANEAGKENAEYENNHGDEPSEQRLDVSTTGRQTNIRPGLFLGADIVDLDMFPEHIRGAIERVESRNGNASWISMRFVAGEETESMRCTMRIDVISEKVKDLAMLLFDAQLEVNNNVRELVLPNGAPATVVQLRGAKIEAIRQVLGEQVARGVEACPLYLHEQSAGAEFTRCVTMTSFMDARLGSFINVQLGFPIATEIFEHFYANYLEDV